MTYLKKCECIEELKKEYRALSLIYHPDVSHDPQAEEIMKAINAEYDELFAELKNVYKNKDGKIYTNKKDVSESPEEFRNIINALIGLKGIEIELLGRWIWVTGETKQYKDTLKKLSFRWCSKKRAWSWHRAEDMVFSRGRRTLGEIRKKYGVISYTKKGPEKIEEKAS